MSSDSRSSELDAVLKTPKVVHIDFSSRYEYSSSRADAFHRGPPRPLFQRRLSPRPPEGLERTKPLPHGTTTDVPIHPSTPAILPRTPSSGFISQTRDIVTHRTLVESPHSHCLIGDGFDEFAEPRSPVQVSFKMAHSCGVHRECLHERAGITCGGWHIQNHFNESSGKGLKFPVRLKSTSDRSKHRS